MVSILNAAVIYKVLNLIQRLNNELKQDHPGCYIWELHANVPKYEISEILVKTDCAIGEKKTLKVMYS
jgi:hypothetical protein